MWATGRGQYANDPGLFVGNPRASGRRRGWRTFHPSGREKRTRPRWFIYRRLLACLGTSASLRLAFARRSAYGAVGAFGDGTQYAIARSEPSARSGLSGSAQLAAATTQAPFSSSGAL